MENKINKATYKNDLGVISKRFVGYLIDWYVGALVTALPLAVFSQKYYGNMSNQNILHFDQSLGVVLGVVTILFAIFYYILVPLFIYPGQTPGKRICKLKIVSKNGKAVKPINLVSRQLLGIFIIEGSLYSVSTIFHQLLSIVFSMNFVTPLMYAGIIVSLASALFLLFGKNQRALHDLVGQTRVISSK